MTELACPLCRATLREVNREGVAIDVCGQCRGIWLDRGELEKLLAMARGSDAAFADGGAPLTRYQETAHQGQRDMRRYHDDDDHHDRRHYDGGGRHHRKRSRFESIFDIFD